MDFLLGLLGVALLTGVLYGIGQLAGIGYNRPSNWRYPRIATAAIVGFVLTFLCLIPFFIDLGFAPNDPFNGLEENVNQQSNWLDADAVIDYALLGGVWTMFSAWMATNLPATQGKEQVVDKKHKRYVETRFIASIPIENIAETITQNSDFTVNLTPISPDEYKFTVKQNSSHIYGTLHRWNHDETKVEANVAFRDVHGDDGEELIDDLMDVFKSKGDVAVLSDIIEDKIGTSDS